MQPENPQKTSSPIQTKIVRKPLLTALMPETKNVDRVEVKQIDFTPHQQTGLHLHPCPVVGLIVRGSIIFQIEGEPERILRPGDAFHEPAGKTILRFDAADEPTTFVGFYLLASKDHDLIQMLAQ